METLYPVQAYPPENHQARGNGADAAVTVLVHCRVDPADEPSFRTTLEKLLDDFDRFPGTRGSMVFRCPAGGQVELSILQRFADEQAHQVWQASPEFARWREAVAPDVPTPDHVRRYVGMEALFASTSAQDAPPRWKMAILLMVVVYPCSLLISTWGAPALAALSVYAGALLTSVAMVVLMTYVFVPILTKIFQRWLTPASA